MQPVDLLILTLAVYLLTDALVNRALPFGVMAKIRDKTQWQGLTCMYCSVWYAALAVYILWVIEPIFVHPLAIGGGAILAWRYTGGNHV